MYARSTIKTITVGGRVITFRSMFEAKWARYLQILKEQGHIKDWRYEAKTFYFHNFDFGAVQYTPDFEITEKNGQVVYQELKGILDGRMNTKFRRLSRQFPDVVAELVVMKNDSRRSGQKRIASKYVRRIIDADQIFRQMKGVI